MLGAARTLARYDIKVIGVNRGNLGFLTDLDPDNEHDGPTLVKSGPKDLAAFHEGEVAKEEKKRGRPKKSVVADAF